MRNRQKGVAELEQRLTIDQNVIELNKGWGTWRVATLNLGPADVCIVWYIWKLVATGGPEGSLPMK